MRFDGDISLSPMGARQTAVRVALKLNSSSSTLLFAMDAIVLAVLLLGAIMAKNFMLFAFIGAICAVQYWIISSRWAGDLAQGIGNWLMLAGQSAFPAPAGTSGQMATQKSSSPPVPPPIPVSSSQDISSMRAASDPSFAPGKAAQETTVFEQLKQLGALRDAGVLTADEFDNKKAELLKRV